MKKLSKQDEARREELGSRIGAAHSALMEKIEEANADIAAANEALEALNEALNEARGFAEDMASEIDSYMDDRSDGWREGDRGQAYEEWKSEWENFQPEDLDEFPELEDPSDKIAEATEALDGLPSEPNF